MLSALWGQSTIKGPSDENWLWSHPNEQQTKKVDVNILMSIWGNSLEKQSQIYYLQKQYTNTPASLHLDSPTVNIYAFVFPSSLLSFYWCTNLPTDLPSFSDVMLWVPQNTTTGTCSARSLPYVPTYNSPQ